MNFYNASPTTTATLLIPGNSNRTGLTLVNAGSVTVYIGKHSGVTTATGFPIASGDSIEIEALTENLYGITSSGTGDIRMAETV